jgi:hypothetical protein
MQITFLYMKKGCLVFELLGDKRLLRRSQWIDYEEMLEYPRGKVSETIPLGYFLYLSWIGTPVKKLLFEFVFHLSKFVFGLTTLDSTFLLNADSFL